MRPSTVPFSDAESQLVDGPLSSTRQWLVSENMGHYISMFDENDISEDLFAHLTADDLRHIGIKSVGHQKRLLLRFQSMKQREVTASISSRKGIKDSVQLTKMASMAATIRGAFRALITADFVHQVQISKGDAVALNTQLSIVSALMWTVAVSYILA